MTPQPARRSPSAAAPFEFKGSIFTLTVMHLRETDIAALDRHLGEKLRQAPGFFANAPVVVELDGLSCDGAVPDFAAIQDLLRARGLIPVGFRTADAELHAAAARAGVPLLPESRGATDEPRPPDRGAAEPTHREPEPAETAREPAGAGKASPSRILTQPVRSGQQVYVPGGDLVVLGTVSPGAEVLADGNVHVYGILRGKALAGAQGDHAARIFCQRLEAELVSIAGRYRVFEQLDPQVRGQPTQMYLADDRLIIEPLSR